MEQVFGYCDDVIVLKDGQLQIHESVEEFFKDGEKCRSMGILPPALIRMKESLAKRGFEIPSDIRDEKSLASYIAKEVVNHG